MAQLKGRAKILISSLHALLRKFDGDNAFFLARALAFDALGCLIPAIFLLFLLLGFLFDSPEETAQYMALYMESMIPFSRPQLLSSLFSVVKAQKIFGLLGIVGLLWTLSRVFSSTRTVLNVVFEGEKRRGVIAGNSLEY